MIQTLQKPLMSDESRRKPAAAWADMNVARTYHAFLSEKQRFCDRLEVFADILPNRGDDRDCLLLAQNIVPLVLRAHAFEEEVIFPRLMLRRDLPVSAPQSFERLKFEHMGDEEFANDLCISLRDFVVNPRHSNPETLSWMLRGFFEGLRRHVAFERELLLPLIEDEKL